MWMKTCIICWVKHSNTMSKCCWPKCQKEHEKNLKAEVKKKKEDLKVKSEIKRLKALTKKRFTRSNLIKEADRVCSIYIRERDKWKPCITCWVPWNETHQNWHFMSRRHFNTRWVESNMAWQCPKCNCWGAWEQYEFALALEKQSPWLPEQIRRLALCTDKISDEEILGYIRIYYHQLDQLAISYNPKKYYLI